MEKAMEGKMELLRERFEEAGAFIGKMGRDFLMRNVEATVQAKGYEDDARRRPRAVCGESLEEILSEWLGICSEQAIDPLSATVLRVRRRLPRGADRGALKIVDLPWGYKDEGAFESREGICYIPELADQPDGWWDEHEIWDPATGTVVWSLAEAEAHGPFSLDCYTYEGILEECGGSRTKARCVFALLEWQHPSTALDELEMKSEGLFSEFLPTADDPFLCELADSEREVAGRRLWEAPAAKGRKVKVVYDPHPEPELADFRVYLEAADEDLLSAAPSAQGGRAVAAVQAPLLDGEDPVDALADRIVGIAATLGRMSDLI